MSRYVLGLIGYPLAHSYSPELFRKRFEAEGMNDWEYRLFPMEDIEALPALLEHTPGLMGLNVTLPHKKTVLRYADHVDVTAREVGAANVLARTSHQGWIALNTDCMALLEILERTRGIHRHPLALILGTGGAASAAAWALRKLGVPFRVVSRKPGERVLTYKDLHKDTVEAATLIIQATPLGMAPAIDTCPELPWEGIGPRHLLIDLVYNPRNTLFMKRGKAAGARVMNGLKMLNLQADYAWGFWRSLAYL